MESPFSIASRTLASPTLWTAAANSVHLWSGREDYMQCHSVTKHNLIQFSHGNDGMYMITNTDNKHSHWTQMTVKFFIPQSLYLCALQTLHRSVAMSEPSSLYWSQTKMWCLQSSSCMHGGTFWRCTQKSPSYPKHCFLCMALSTTATF